MHAKLTLIHLRGFIYFRDILSSRDQNQLWSTFKLFQNFAPLLVFGAIIGSKVDQSSFQTCDEKISRKYIKPRKWIKVNFTCISSTWKGPRLALIHFWIKMTVRFFDPWKVDGSMQRVFWICVGWISTIPHLSNWRPLKILNFRQLAKLMALNFACE